jgi:hypothetical protein
MQNFGSSFERLAQKPRTFQTKPPGVIDRLGDTDADADGDFRRFFARAQLERRHRANILARPTQLVRHDRRGTITVYPAGTQELLLVGLAFEERYRSLERVLWEMWIAGHPVPLIGIRDQLRVVARFHDRISAFLRRMGFGQPELPSKALRLVERVTPRYGGPGVPAVRRRLEGEQQVQTFVRIMADVLAGSYTPPSRSQLSGPSDDEGALIEKALGLDEARTDTPTGMPLLLRGNTAEDLAKGARLVRGNWAGDIDNATDQDLRTARGRWVRFQRHFPRVVDEAREIFGGSAFGLRALARLIGFEDPLMSGIAVIVMLRLGRSENRRLAGDWDKLIWATENWIENSSPLLPAFRVLREVPPLRSLLSAASMRRTLAGPDAQERHRVELLEVATAHETEIAAALARAGVTLATAPATSHLVPPVLTPSGFDAV